MQTPEEVAREVLGCHLIDTDGGPGLPDFTCETTGHDQWDCAVEEERLTDLIRARDAEVAETARAAENARLREGVKDATQPLWEAWAGSGELSLIARTRRNLEDLLNPPTEECTCGFGGVHDDVNPLCGLNPPTEGETR